MAGIEGGSTGPIIIVTTMENGKPASGENQAVMAVDTQVRRLTTTLVPTEQPGVPPIPRANS